MQACALDFQRGTELFFSEGKKRSELSGERVHGGDPVPLISRLVL